MNIPASVVFRDCAAIAVILLCVASAAAQAAEPVPAQVLASYRVCAVSDKGACTPLREPISPCSASREREGHLLWAVALHRAVVTDVGIAMRTVKPVTVASRVDTVVSELRTVACSH